MTLSFKFVFVLVPLPTGIVVGCRSHKLVLRSLSLNSFVLTLTHHRNFTYRFLLYCVIIILKIHTNKTCPSACRVTDWYYHYLLNCTEAAGDFLLGRILSCKMYRFCNMNLCAFATDIVTVI